MSTEQPIELVYTVVIRTYGQRKKVRRSVDQTLARLVQLNFRDSTVSVGKQRVAYRDMRVIGGEA